MEMADESIKSDTPISGLAIRNWEQDELPCGRRNHER
jgi:hypothetical protein